MAFTEIGRVATTVTRTTAQTNTDNVTLSATPASGQWVIVALYSNQNMPTINAIVCGSQFLGPIQKGATGAPEIWGAQYHSGMTTTVSINWTNSVASTILGVAGLVFTGAGTNGLDYATSNAFRQSTGYGLFDGGGSNTFGSGNVSSVSGVTTWTNSVNAIATNYDVQGQPWISAIVDTNIPTSATLQLVRSAGVLGVVSDSSGNLSQLSGTPGTLPISSGTGVYNPAGGTAYGVIYGTYGNFVFSYTGVSGNNLTGARTSASPTFVNGGSYCPIMLAGTSAVTITAILNTTSTTVGNVGGLTTGGINYTSGTASANGHVQIGMGGTGTVSARLHLMAGFSNNGQLKQTAYAVQRINGTNATNGGGSIYTFVPATRTLTRSFSFLSVMVSVVSRSKGYNRIVKTLNVRNALTARVQGWKRVVKAVNVSTALAKRAVSRFKTVLALNAPIGLAVKTSLIQRVVAALSINVGKVTRMLSYNRSVNATQVASAVISKKTLFYRLGTAMVTYSVGVSRSRTFVRRAVATSVALGTLVKLIIFHSHTGTVSGGWVIASAKNSIQMASVSADVTTATVKGTVIFTTKE